LAHTGSTPPWGPRCAVLLAIALLSGCSDFGGGDSSGGGGTDGAEGGLGGGGATSAGSATGVGGTVVNPPPQLYFWDVAFGHGVFVAVGGWSEIGRGIILTSDDGEHWVESYRHDFGDFTNVVAGSDGWIALGGGVLTSADGTVWERTDAQIPVTYADAVWTGSKFLVAGYNTPNGEGLFESDTGTEWEMVEGAEVGPPIAVGPTGILAGGDGKIGFSADDGQTWELFLFQSVRPEGPLLGDAFDVSWDGTRWSATSTYNCCYGETPDSYTHYQLWSDDGLAWEWEQTEQPLSGFAHFEGVSVAFAPGPLAARRSGDGAWTFTESEHFAMAATAGVGSAGARFVGAGPVAITYSDDDGVSWHEAELPSFD